MLRKSRAVLAAIAIVLAATVFTDAAQAAQRFFLFEPPFSSLSDGRPRFETRVRSGKVRLAPEFRRQVVAYDGHQPPGTIIVNTGRKFLYFVLPGGKAIRYGIGTARDGFEWSGTHKVTRKAEWPGWTPPAEMKRRQPNLPDYMPGGINNPLGARAIYIGSTLYRIHGTNEPWTIGQNVSSGCIRMVNADVEDLYERVKIGARVIVL
ncbi:MAG: L,D-transpeptidase [Devosia sp.]|uniref:L,D-transpeptidase n=1 Tax=Devosia sp. TaxID=1871048 RepID=UPI001AD0D740|nr:L,D-transpeptidase [Devosia sp.]MBN9316892.1 L,D-transpeptidase [Devosia sp.]